MLGICVIESADSSVFARRNPSGLACISRTGEAPANSPETANSLLPFSATVRKTVGIAYSVAQDVRLTLRARPPRPPISLATISLAGERDKTDYESPNGDRDYARSERTVLVGELLLGNGHLTFALAGSPPTFWCRSISVEPSSIVSRLRRSMSSSTEIPALPGFAFF